MARVVIAFGSNVGDRLDFIRQAVQCLQNDLSGIQVSPLYETAPMYVEDQPAFLNGVLAGETELGPLCLLRRLKETEQAVGRTKAPRNGPREIDLDLVLYGGLVLLSDAGDRKLAVPHPRLAERRFVLQPLADLDPELRIPTMGSVSAMLEATESQAASVRRYSDAVL